MNLLEWIIPSAHAQAAGAPTGGSMLGLIIPMLLIFAMFFFMSRSQNKRAQEHQKMVGGLVKNDEVVTTGGIAGRVDELGDTYISLEIAPNVKIKVERNAIGKVLPKGSLKA
jgi:preprotein translocase subunit YajC